MNTKPDQQTIDQAWDSLIRALTVLTQAGITKWDGEMPKNIVDYHSRVLSCKFVA